MPESGWEVPMKVEVARSAGFCFGVRRAVEICAQQAQNGKKPVYTYGPIIHNEQVVSGMEKKGVHVINGPEELGHITRGTVIIRSHGVGKKIYDQINAQGLALVDATCPFVKKIHRIVQERTSRGEEVVIIGDARHPEVEGIVGWARGPVTVIGNEQEARAFAEAPENSGSQIKKLTIVSQTTFNSSKFHNLVEIIRKKRYYVLDILNTICNATEDRQAEAKELASRSDVMIVIGGKNSSNTQKLFEICKRECENTYYIQSLADLDIRLLPSMSCVGITAGASTPNNLIEEVSQECQK